ncbi:GDSL-type esterase/lipase family protein [Actinophytocola sp.]|uniref:GDSL-type esterase/lipase family protein n=1 Tax=Actinophytocola sp. TaxID=1872138 RepID=UPI003D6B2579
MRPTGWRAWVTLAVVILLFGTVLLVSDGRAPDPTPLPGPPQDAPRVLVAMGDSTISGEGAGEYEEGTDGEDGNWCHRSRHASIHQTGLETIDRTFNLACSGAPSPQVGLGDVEQYTEPSQAERLAAIAAGNRVAAVVVGAGANDEPAFSHVLDACVEAWTGRGEPCGESVGPEWSQRVDKMVPKLVRALEDIRTVMSNAGYEESDYQLIVQSYAAPVGPNVADGLQDLSGCPFRSDDLRWVQRDAVPVLTAGVREAAARVGARFLDLSRAGIGHEACSNERDQSTEWFRRLAVKWDDLQHEDRATHALQESFHPNATGHEQIGGCLGEFLYTPDQAAACLAGEGGDLHPASSVGP